MTAGAWAWYTGGEGGDFCMHYLNKNRTFMGMDVFMYEDDDKEDINIKDEEREFLENCERGHEERLEKSFTN